MKIFYSNSFAKKYKKLPNSIKDIAEKKGKIFRKDPFDPELKTHKLHGRLSSFWSFSINIEYRIIFEFVSRDLIYFHIAGRHDIYDR